MNKFKTEQENFWAGEFGDEYHSRNESDELLASNLNFFCNSLKTVPEISECIEFGANIGLNLKALKLLYPKLDQYAVEINSKASNVLAKNIEKKKIFHESILDFEPKRKWELVLIKGVLIHLNQDYLGRVYEKLMNSTSKYLLICEYYNPKPIMISYRGHDEKLYKRDFAGEILDYYPNLQLRDYGFAYHRDTSFPQDDINWFLLEKIN